MTPINNPHKHSAHTVTFSSNHHILTVKPSEIPPTNEGLSTFACFPRLPPEIREMVWKCLIPVQRHLRIEGRFGEPTKIGSFSISEGFHLSQVCSESQKVLDRVIAYQTAKDGDDASVDEDFGTVLLTTLDKPSLEILSSLTANIDCIAVPWPARTGEVKEFHVALHKRVAAGGRQIKAIYTGRSSELGGQLRPPRNHYMTPLADFEVMTEDDAEIYPHSRDCFFVARSRSEYFIYTTRDYKKASEDLRSTWERLPSKDGTAEPTIKPGFILIRAARRRRLS
ncbi:hypothetical protein BFJ72_g10123 [Fusarium proliferatum]|uniref:2EXR domain-containing protein n=1 Tax=Gibberella intermedia TaxID=948311 RepID=A0A420SV15_GIBIN|nr:hypothetical protein BFJ72_g10123 [Fusarium proliferatum]